MGADALRFALARLNTSGAGRIRLNVKGIEENRNFINKLWNATRFALANLDGFDPERFVAHKSALAMPERWILSRLQTVCGEVDEKLEAFAFSDAANAIYHFVYDELCDWYIELAKAPLNDVENAANRHATQGVLATALETTMRLLHPFAPFVTEEIWQKLPKKPELPGSLMITIFPKPDPSFSDPEAEAEMTLVQDIVVGCRMLKQTYGVPPAKDVDVELRIPDAARREKVAQRAQLIAHRVKVKLAIVESGGPVPGSAKTLIGADVEIVMPLGGLIDPKVESERITKDIGRAEKEIASIEARLAKPDFIARSPAEVVAENRARLGEEQARKARLQDALATLGGRS
jgi:valyl-tRNA synthetase